MISIKPHHLEALAQRWITPELAQEAGLFSVDSQQGAELVQRNGRNDYSGIAIPYRSLHDGQVFVHRLRRDYPDKEQRSDGTFREKGKYLSPPGVSVAVYHPPNVTSCKNDIPFILVEGEFKTL